MTKIAITKKQQTQHQLPEKALGDWAVENITDNIVTLHKLKQDGTLGSDRKSNIYKVDVSLLEKIAPEFAKPKVEKYDDSSAIGTRKARWIADLLKAFEADPFLSKLLNNIENLKQKILEDTNSSKGKKYSSIEGALRVWNARLRKGEV